MIDTITDLLILSYNSDIDIFYNEEMGVFPTTIWDGYDSINEQTNIINKSIRLPKINGTYTDDELKDICYRYAIKWCVAHNYIIKKIKEEDLEECLKVIHISYLKRDEVLGLSKDTHRHSYMTIEELKDRYNKGMIMYGYYDEDKLVGYISYIIRDNDIKIKDIVVLPEYQNKGIGKILIDIVKEETIKLNKNIINLRFIYENEKLRKWYEKNGFELIDIMKYEGSDTSIGEMEYHIK